MKQKLQQLQIRANDLERTVFKRLTERDVIQKSLQKATEESGFFSSREDSLVRIQKFFQSLSSQEQGRLQRWLEQVISYGLQSVFGKGYGFTIPAPEVKGNEVITEFKVTFTTEDGTVLELDPYDEMGGGPVDVLSFLLQFILVFLLRDRIQPVLFLDEAFKHLSGLNDLSQKMADLLRELVDRTGVQVVLVTHNPVYERCGDVVYRFSKNRLQTVVDKI